MVLEFGLLNSELFPASDAAGEGLNAEMQEQLRQEDGYGVVPIGGIIAWLKSYANTPTLNSAFVECNGQVLADTDSPYNGATIPDLNSATNRFLRGNTASGTTGGALTHTHTQSYASRRYADYNFAYGPRNHEPPYYDVVWVMRIK